MKLSKLIYSECERYRKECNFTPSELQVFNLLAADKSLVQVSMQLNLSESAVSARVKSIKEKIQKVDSL